MSDFSLISQHETNKVLYSDHPHLSSFPFDYSVTPGLIASSDFYLLAPMNPDSYEQQLYTTEKQLNIVEPSKSLEAPKEALVMIGEGSSKSLENESAIQSSDNQKQLSNQEILQAMKTKARLFVTSDDTKIPKSEIKKVKRNATKIIENKNKQKKIKTSPKYFSFKD